jgi:hypothetical protein
MREGCDPTRAFNIMYYPGMALLLAFIACSAERGMATVFVLYLVAFDLLAHLIRDLSLRCWPFGTCEVELPEWPKWSKALSVCLAFVVLAVAPRLRPPALAVVIAAIAFVIGIDHFRALIHGSGYQHYAWLPLAAPPTTCQACRSTLRGQPEA